MPYYRRATIPGATYFLTATTYRRQPIFSDSTTVNHLKQVIREVKQSHPFTINAWVILPDHMHCIWTLPEGDSDFSTRMGMIKAKFSGRFARDDRYESTKTNSQRKHRERAIWQRRFWERTVRDHADLIRCMDYLHFNPVKHNLVKQVSNWPYSTFHRFVQIGYYPRDWGSTQTFENGNFGE